MSMEDELCVDTPPMTRAATISRTAFGWEFEVFQEDGEEFAAGTAPTITGILDMVQEYLYAEYYESRQDTYKSKILNDMLGEEQ
jgi:hypothetical protein